MEIKSNLPKKEKYIRKYFENCCKRKKFIEAERKFYDKHLKKAKHDLYRAIKEFEDDCWDWTIIKAYYSIHHAGNSLLLNKEGIFCKDHSCLIIALKINNLIDEKLFKELEKVDERLSDTLGLDLTFQLRKISQYNVNEWEHLTKEDANLVVSVAKKFVSFVENATNNE